LSRRDIPILRIDKCIRLFSLQRRNMSIQDIKNKVFMVNRGWDAKVKRDKFKREKENEILGK